MKLVAAAACLALLGCTIPIPEPIYRTSDDPYSGTTSISVDRIQAFQCAGKQTDYNDISIGAALDKTKGRKDQYFLTITYVGTGWAFFEKGGSLDAIIDGVPRVFYAKSHSTRNILSGSTVIETIYYDVERSDIESILNTKVFQFRVAGTLKILERCMDPEHRAPLKKFLDTTRDN